MPDDDVVAENIRLRQELEALRSLLQRQGTESGIPTLSEPERSEEVAPVDASHPPGQQVQKSNHSKEKDSDQIHQNYSTSTLKADTYSFSTSSRCDLQKKQTFAWSWQDECGIWREYDPDICEVCSPLIIK
jgi:hypothetical protein